MWHLNTSLKSSLAFSASLASSILLTSGFCGILCCRMAFLSASSCSLLFFSPCSSPYYKVTGSRTQGKVTRSRPLATRAQDRGSMDNVWPWWSLVIILWQNGILVTVRYIKLWKWSNGSKVKQHSYSFFFVWAEYMKLWLRQVQSVVHDTDEIFYISVSHVLVFVWMWLKLVETKVIAVVSIKCAKL